MKRFALGIGGIASVFLAIGFVVLAGVVFAAAFKPEDRPTGGTAINAVERVELPGVGSVYTFDLHGHRYICNPRGDVIHATEFCPCRSPESK